jgi:outer membrane lipoprotein-sorting protein
MKTLAFLAVSAVLVASARQANLPDDLAGDFNKLSSAKSLKVEYSYRKVGEAPQDYKLSFSKPNMFRLDYSAGFIMADGKSIYRFDKGSKTYTVKDETEKAFAAFWKRPDVLAWAPFFEEHPADRMTTIKEAGDHTLKGTPTKEFDIVLKEAGGSVSLYIDPVNGVAKGFDLKKDDKDYLAIASTVTVGTDALPDTLFAFTPPDGSKKVDVLASDATYGVVQGILSDNCMPCHGAQNHSAGINLTNYAGVSAIVNAGDAAGSTLVKALKGDGIKQMPLNRPALSDDDILTISTWITNGAKQD